MNTSTIIQSTPDQYEILLNNYTSIVEKTNQQLSLWLNPYGLMVGILTILIAISAIVVSYILWKNSLDQKKRTEEFFNKIEENNRERLESLDKTTKDREEKAKKYEESLDKLITEYEIKLKNVKKDDTGEIKRLEKAIEELNKSKLSVGFYQIPETFSDESYPLYSFNNRKTTVCDKCKKAFEYKDKNNMAEIKTFSFLNSKKVTCPFCGFDNLV